MATEDRAAHETDEELAARSADGGKEAFAELYERHYGGIYDFAIRILRDPDAAADVVQATFTRAWPALTGGTRPANVRAWLYGIARNLSIDELRRRRRLFPTEGLGLGLAELPDPAAFDPSETVETKELAELVWTSAAGLRAEEYALLDLHVRRGLNADELADTLGVRRGAVYTRLTRLRQALESAVATSLLVRHGRGKCPDLDRLVAIQRAQGTTPLEGRRVIQSHVEDCSQCQQSKGIYASPAQILASLALVPPPEELGEAIWAIVGAGAALVGAGAAAASAKTGGVGGLLSQAPVPLGIAAGSLATLATVVTLGVWAAGGNDGGASAAKVSQTTEVEQPAARPVSPPAAKAKLRPRKTERARPGTRTTRPASASARPEPSAPAAQFSAVPPELAKFDRPPASERPPPPPSPRPTSPPPPSPSTPPPPPAPPPPAPPGPPPPPPAPPPPPPPAAPPPPPPPPPSPPPPPPPEKVAMCLHGNTLIVSLSAVPGLLRAGATMGACSILDD